MYLNLVILVRMQYTMIDEASRERFIYPYKEQSSFSTIDFVKRAIVYFGYKPKKIRTDNGSEFTYTKETARIHPLDNLLSELQITHQLIRPRTPSHNGKVERSHRNDQNRFYNFLSFYSYEDLKVQMKAYLKRSNNIPMQVLNWISPLEKRKQIIEAKASTDTSKQLNKFNYLEVPKKTIFNNNKIIVSYCLIFL